MSFLLAAVLVVSLEIVLVLFVSMQRRKFQWLITEKDELPEFDHAALEKFIGSSFDPRLGWVRKPDSTGTEQGRNGVINFTIDSLGSRVNRFNRSAPVVAAFGDSYAFCRQVEDHETWEAQLAEQGGFSVLNFGVGNYGLDQALLRYENTQLPDSVKIVIMGFVPETICRIQSYWKHYLEFGNTFAFKPRFVLDSAGELKLVESPMSSIDDFTQLSKKLPGIRQIDGFYQSKFRSLQYRFPYTLSLLRNPIKQISLIGALGLRGLMRCLGLSGQWSENLPFMQVMQSNIRDAHNQYKDACSCDLLSAICCRFQKEANARGHIPLLLVMPQLLDLEICRDRGKTPYQRYFADLAQQLPVLDVTDNFVLEAPGPLYINDQYGGHLSAEGNRRVAEEIKSWLQGIDAFQTQ